MANEYGCLECTIDIGGIPHYLGSANSTGTRSICSWKIGHHKF